MNDTRKLALDARAIALLVGCAMLWGLSQTAMKATLHEVPPLLQGGLRSLGAAAALLLWMRARALPVFAGDGTLRAGLLAGMLFAVEFGCIFAGLQFTSASRMAVFLYLSPFVVALGMPFIAHSERLHGGQFAGLALAFSGVVWAFAEGFFGQPTAGARQWLGDALGVAAAVLWGATTLVLRATRLSTALPEKTLLYQLAVSGLLLTAVSALVGEPWPHAAHDWSPATWGSMLFQAGVVSFASYLVWFWLMRHYPATHIASFTLLTPVFGLLAGVLLLGEPLTLRLVVALAAVCTGIVFVNQRQRAR